MANINKLANSSNKSTQIYAMVVITCLLLLGIYAVIIDKKVELAFTTLAEELVEYNNKEVEILGYMSPQSPIDGSVMYLMDTPYQSEVFTSVENNILGDTIAVYPKDGQVFEYSFLPIKVKGTFVIEDTTDSKGYGYNFKIVDGTYIPINLTNMSENVQDYGYMAESGFVYHYAEVIQFIYQNINWAELGYDPKILEPIGEDDLNFLYGLTVEDEKYKELTEVVEETRLLVRELDEELESGEVKDLVTYADVFEEIYIKYNEWLKKGKL